MNDAIKEGMTYEGFQPGSIGAHYAEQARQQMTNTPPIANVGDLNRAAQEQATMTTKTRKLNQTETAFARFCEATGIQNLVLNHGPNGYTVAQIINDAGGQHKVFGWEAYPRKQFIAMLNFAADAADLAKNQ